MAYVPDPAIRDRMDKLRQNNSKAHDRLNSIQEAVKGLRGCMDDLFHEFRGGPLSEPSSVSARESKYSDSQIDGFNNYFESRSAPIAKQVEELHTAMRKLGLITSIVDGD